MNKNIKETIKTTLLAFVIAIIFGVIYGVINGLLFNGKSSIVELSFVFIIIGIGIANVINNYCNVSPTQGKIIAALATIYAILMGDYIFALSTIAYDAHVGIITVLQILDGGFIRNIIIGPFEWFYFQTKYVFSEFDFSMIIGYIFRIMGVLAAYNRVEEHAIIELQDTHYSTDEFKQSVFADNVLEGNGTLDELDVNDYQSEVTNDFDPNIYKESRGNVPAVINAEVEEHDID